MVLAGENQPAHAGRFDGTDPLTGIHPGRIENRRAFRAVAPFTVGKGVDGEMDENLKRTQKEAKDNSVILVFMYLCAWAFYALCLSFASTKKGGPTYFSIQ